MDGSADIAIITPPRCSRIRGRYMGVIGSSWNTAIGVGPLVGLWLFARSPEMLWILCGVAGIAAAGLMLIRANVHEDKPAQDVTALKKAPISP